MTVRALLIVLAVVAAIGLVAFGPQLAAWINGFFLPTATPLAG